MGSPRSIHAKTSGWPAMRRPTLDNLLLLPHCGSTVYWELRRKPEMVAVAVGAFADPAFPAPSQAVYAEHRHIWVPNLPPG
jgi:hypothetical protein